MSWIPFLEVESRDSRNKERTSLYEMTVDADTAAAEDRARVRAAENVAFMMEAGGGYRGKKRERRQGEGRGRRSRSGGRNLVGNGVVANTDCYSRRTTDAAK